MPAEYHRSFLDGEGVPPVSRSPTAGNATAQVDPFYNSEEKSGTLSSTGAALGSAGDAHGDSRRQQGSRCPAFVASMPPTAAAAVAAAVAVRQAPAGEPVGVPAKTPELPGVKAPINVWGSGSPEASSAVPGAPTTEETNNNNGQRRRSSSRSWGPSVWVVADESSRDVGNGRKVHETKLVQRGHLACEPGETVEMPITAVAAASHNSRNDPIDDRLCRQYPQHSQQQQLLPATLPPTQRPTESSGAPVQEAASELEDRAATPTPPDKPAHAAARARHIARWVLDMRHRQAERVDDEGDDVGGGSRGGGFGCGGQDDGATEVTSDRLQWPTLLRDPAINNNSLPATEPTGALHRLRMRILTNFAARCRADHRRRMEGRGGEEEEENRGQGEESEEQGQEKETQNQNQSQNHHLPICLLCSPADAFTMRPQHGRLFLDGVLLPLSEAISYADMVAHVNTSVIERVFEDAGLGETHAMAPAAGPWEAIRAMPIYEDYQRALVLATHRRRVFDELPMVVDACGMVIKGGRK